MSLISSRPHSTHAKDFIYCDIKVGDKFNDITVIGLGNVVNFDSGSKCGYIRCECSNGHKFEVLSHYLKSGLVNACPECCSESSSEDMWLYQIARDIYNECFDKSTKLLKDGKICDLGNSISEIKNTIRSIPGWVYKETSLWFIDPSKGYTIHHPRHKDNLWTCLDVRTNLNYRCRGNLRWIPSSEIKQRAHELTVDQLTDTPRSNQAFLRICNTRNWNPEEFTKTWQSYKVGRKGWLFKPLPEFDAKYRYPYRDISDESEVIIGKEGDE